MKLKTRIEALNVADNAQVSEFIEFESKTAFMMEQLKTGGKDYKNFANQSTLTNLFDVLLLN